VASQRAWPLTEAVLIMARKAARSPAPGLAEAGRQAEARLLQPLHVALVGLVSAGKSTLLNALLETAVAPTAGGECTRVLYTFSHNRYTTAAVRPRNQTAPLPLHFDGSRLSSELPLPHREIDRVEVTLPASLLEQVTVLDTPGLASTNADTSAITEQLLENDTLNAAQTADAIIFCINTPLKDTEAKAAQLFRSGRAGLRLTGGTAVAVLTKADLLAAADRLTHDRRATWKHAADLAQKLSTDHADLFAGVLPVIGLLAETAQTGALREYHARLLAALAREWSPETAGPVLLHEKLFYAEPGPGDAGQRRELVALLGLFGIGTVLDELRAGAPATAAGITNIALQASGFGEMSRRLRIQLGSRADVLKSGAQLNILLDQAQAAGEWDTFNAVQKLLDRPEMFDLKVFGLAQVLASGRVKPPPALADQAWILLSTGLPRVSGREAASRAREWREWAMLTNLEGQAVARVMVRAWALVSQRQGGPGDRA
jgi:Dynamin family